MKVDRCKGSRDLSPEEMAKFRLIEGTFRDCCLKWGYGEVRTPTLEYLHLFTSTGTLTPNMLGKVYSFLDWDGWSGERVVLRPDGTIPVARLYTESMEDKELAKLFYVTNIFIFEETGKENREKWQCGAELVGGGPPLADVELIMLASEVLQKLGLKDVEVRLSHAGLIRTILDGLGLSTEERTAIFDKILDGDMNALAKIEAAKPDLHNILTLLLGMKGKTSGFLKNMRALFNLNLPELEPSLKDFIAITRLLENLGCQYKIDLASGRGFEYYTGAMFQLYICDNRVGGGGRYDALIPLMGGKNTPASGFALYLDKIMEMVELPEESPSRILINADAKTEAMKEVYRIASQLRQAGYIVEFNLGQKPAESRWTLDVSSKESGFVLTDAVTNKSFKAQTADEVLSILKR